MSRADLVLGTASSDGRGRPGQQLTETVVSIIAEVTRYPVDILKPDANLEDDLGIDSVKRLEILTVLGTRLGLPENRPAEGSAEAEVPKTIGDLVDAVAKFIQKEAAASEPVPSPAAPPTKAAKAESNGVSHAPAPPPPANGSLGGRVIDIIAEVTRFPRDLLVPSADLEEDLGFDIRQQKTILEALRGRLRLQMPESAALPSVRTLADLIGAVERLLPAEGQKPAAQPVPVRAPQTAERPASRDGSRRFAGKVALVTGAGHGIGRAIARHLAAAGATVAVNSFHSRQRGEETTAEIVAAGGKAVHVWGSVTNQAHLSGFFKDIDSQFGGVDFLVHNASNGILAPIANVEPEHWDRAFRTNVVALHQASMLAAASMRRRGGGKIVALSSVGAQRHMDYLGCIGTVKAAVESLVRYLAVELGGDNIQVNAVSAGPVYGELMEKYPDLEKLRPRCEALTPRGRLNDEDEVAEAVAFLLGSSGMSGSVLLLDAGGCQRISASLPESANGTV